MDPTSRMPLQDPSLLAREGLPRALQGREGHTSPKGDPHGLGGQASLGAKPFLCHCRPGK